MSNPIDPKQLSSESLFSPTPVLSTARKQVAGKTIRKNLPPKKRGHEAAFGDDTTTVATKNLGKLSEEPPAKKLRLTKQPAAQVRTALLGEKYTDSDIDKVVQAAAQALETGKIVTKLSLRPTDVNHQWILLSHIDAMQEPQLVQKKLGEGAIKTAFKVLSLLTGKNYVFAATKAQGAKTVARKAMHFKSIEDEYRISQKYKESPYILKIHSLVETKSDSGSYGMRGYMAEYCDQGDLFDEIKQHPLSIERLKQVGSQICMALMAMHNQGDVHLDIKGENIFLTGTQKEVRLADFGFTTNVTQMTPLVGTFHTIDPAFVKAAGKGTTHPHPAYDIYSLGALFYEMRHGTTPFENYFPSEIITEAYNNYKKGVFEPFYTLCEEVRKGLAISEDPVDQLILKMTASDVTERPTPFQVWLALGQIKTEEAAAV